jgi:DNA recombination protein RmuC
VNTAWWWVLIALLGGNFFLTLWLVLRRVDPRLARDLDSTRSALLEALHAGTARTDMLERELRREIDNSSRGARQELTQNLALFQQTLLTQGAEATRTQNTQIDAFGQQLALLQQTLTDTLHTQLQSLSDANARRMMEVRQTLEAQLSQLQASNSSKLDEMRATVDEKLQATLQARLGESFKQVADRLEQVHKGLGEMQTLAQGVGDLKHLLTNVKTRGIFGEAQRAAGAGFRARPVCGPGCHASGQQEHGGFRGPAAWSFGPR